MYAKAEIDPLPHHPSVPRPDPVPPRDIGVAPVGSGCGARRALWTPRPRRNRAPPARRSWTRTCSDCARPSSTAAASASSPTSAARRAASSTSRCRGWAVSAIGPRSRPTGVRVTAPGSSRPSRVRSSPGWAAPRSAVPSTRRRLGVAFAFFDPDDGAASQRAASRGRGRLRGGGSRARRLARRADRRDPARAARPRRPAPPHPGAARPPGRDRRRGSRAAGVPGPTAGRGPLPRGGRPPLLRQLLLRDGHLQGARDQRPAAASSTPTSTTRRSSRPTWCSTAGSRRTRCRPGSGPSRSGCCATTGRSTRCKATSTGCSPEGSSAPKRPASDPRTCCDRCSTASAPTRRSSTRPSSCSSAGTRPAPRGVDARPRGLGGQPRASHPRFASTSATTPASPSRGTAPPGSSSATGGGSAPRWTATGCAPSAGSGPTTASSCAAPRPARCRWPATARSGVGASAPARCSGSTRTRRRRGRTTRTIKWSLAARAPYGEWNRDGLVPGSAGTPIQMPPDRGELTRRQVAYGCTGEEVTMVLQPLATDAKEPTFSMGDDTPFAAVATRPRPMFNFLKQRFAQVSNPPIDHLRERIVMSLRTCLGPRRALLSELPEAARLLELPTFFLYPDAVARLLDPARAVFPAHVLDATFPTSDGPDGPARRHRRARHRRGGRACGAAPGCSSSRIGPSARPGRRSRRCSRSARSTGVSSPSGSGRPARSSSTPATHATPTRSRACSATAPTPSVPGWRSRPSPRWPTTTASVSSTAAAAQSRYQAGVEDGVLKIMSKMGISTVDGYRGAQIFEAVGIGRERHRDLPRPHHLDGRRARLRRVRRGAARPTRQRLRERPSDARAARVHPVPQAGR